MAKPEKCSSCGDDLSHPKWLIDGDWYCKDCWKEEV